MARPLRRSSRLAAVLAVSALLAVACGDDTADSPATGETSTTTAPATTAPAEDAPIDDPPELTASATGVTPEVIRLGVLFPDLSVIGRNNGDLEAKYQVAIDAVNAEGGINGRDIELHFRAASPLDEALFDEQCTEHTEDIEIFAVIGVFLRDQINCYSELHRTIAINHVEVTDEQLERANAPIISVPARPGSAVPVNVQALIDGGVLSPGDRIAIHGVDGAEDLHERYRTALETAGVVIVADTMSTNAADIPAVVSEATVFGERWRTNGAVAVLGTRTNAAGPIFVGMEELDLDLPILLPEGLDRPPSIIASSLGTSEKFHLGVVLTGDEGAIPQWNDDINGVRACTARFEAESGETIYTTETGEEPLENLGPTMVACELVELFTAVAREAGPDLTHETFAAAIESIGEFTITGVSAGSLGPDKPYYSDALPRLSYYNPDSEQFEVS